MRITTRVHTGPGPERDAYVASVQAFNNAQKQHPGGIKAELVPLPESDYDKAVQRAAKERKLPCVLTSLVRQGTVDGRLYSVGQYDSGLALSRTFAEAVNQIAKGADVQQTLDRAAKTIDEYIATADAAGQPARKTP